jgi:hypothetical protein
MAQETHAPAEAKPHRIVLTPMEAEALLIALYGLIKQYPGRGQFFHLIGNTKDEKFSVEVRDNPDRGTKEALLKSVDVAVGGGTRGGEIMRELDIWRHDPLIIAIDAAYRDHFKKQAELEAAE